MQGDFDNFCRINAIMNDVNIVLFHEKCKEKYCTKCIYFDYCHPINPMTGAALDDIIFGKYMLSRHYTVRTKVLIESTIYGECFTE